MNAIADLRSGTYEDRSTMQRVCILYCDGRPVEVGRYSMILPKNAQHFCEAQIWAEALGRRAL